MELRIIDKKENKLLDRIEVTCKVSFTGATPSTEQVRDSIVSQMKAKPENVVVKLIDTVYGYSEANVKAFVYSSPESKEKYEPRLGKKAVEKIEKRKKAVEEAKKKAEEDAAKAKEEAKKAAEAPAEEAKEETAEEVKEEKKEEGKKEEGKKEEGKKEETPAEEPKAEEKPKEEEKKAE